jgi:peptide/nickel transport system ATP-binding protein
VPEALLQVRNLKTHFRSRTREIRAVDGIDLDVHQGQIVCLVGESGSGKSVTSLSVMRLVPRPHGRIVDGTIRFDGRELLTLSEREMNAVRGNEIAMIFQEPMTALNPVLTIGEQVAEVLYVHRGTARKESLEAVTAMLRRVGVPRAEEILREYPHQLSGGLRQRAMIAMAMICGPRLLIADEPTTALDVTIQAQVLQLMKEVRQEFRTSIVLITHDLGVVAEMADQVYVMYAGQIVESVAADVLFQSPIHPYTTALMDSIPSLTAERDVLYSIPGNVPDAAAYPAGCRFASRCPIAQPSCRDHPIQLREVKPGHFVRCDLI